MSVDRMVDDGVCELIEQRLKKSLEYAPRGTDWAIIAVNVALLLGYRLSEMGHALDRLAEAVAGGSK